MALTSSLLSDGWRNFVGHIECPNTCYRRIIRNHIFADKVARGCRTYQKADNNFVRPS